MALTDTHVRNAKPKAQAYKLSDGGGMYLLVRPDGARYWRLDYRFAGKRRTLALGIYPTITLAAARARREDARVLLAQGADPSAAKKAKRRAALQASETSSRGNGFTTSASDSPRAIAYKSWHGLKAMYSHKLVHDRLQKLMRPSCWMSFGRSNNAECSKPRGVYASPAGRYFAMPL
jgi:hypothetical protein